MSRTILVFESDPSFARELQYGFGRKGATVHIATDGRDAMQKATGIAPDLIILSAELNDANGFLLCKELKKHEALQATPIILTSSDPDAEAVFAQHRKLRTRANGYVKAPSPFDAVWQEVGPLVDLEDADVDHDPFSASLAPVLPDSDLSDEGFAEELRTIDIEEVGERSGSVDISFDDVSVDLNEEVDEEEDPVDNMPTERPRAAHFTQGFDVGGPNTSPRIKAVEAADVTQQNDIHVAGDSEIPEAEVEAAFADDDSAPPVAGEATMIVALDRPEPGPPSSEAEATPAPEVELGGAADSIPPVAASPTRKRILSLDAPSIGKPSAVPSAPAARAHSDPAGGAAQHKQVLELRTKLHEKDREILALKQQLHDRERESLEAQEQLIRLEEALSAAQSAQVAADAETASLKAQLEERSLADGNREAEAEAARKQAEESAQRAESRLVEVEAAHEALKQRQTRSIDALQRALNELQAEAPIETSATQASA